MAYNNNIEQLATDIKGLNDADLQHLVSLLSSDSDMEDEENKSSSCMGAMAYVWRTSRAVIKQRDFTLREQAAMDDTGYRW